LFIAGDYFGDVSGLSCRAGGEGLILHEFGHVCDGLTGCLIEGGEVYLLVRQFGWPCFNPAGALTVAVNAIGVVGAVELVSFR
jgi:hypothetical protein